MEAAQTLAKRLLLAAYAGEMPDVTAFANGLRQTLLAPELDKAFKALMLQMPGEAEMTTAIGRDVDASRVHQSRIAILQSLSAHLASDLRKALDETKEVGPYQPAIASTARRSLRLASLALLSYAEPDAAVAIAQSEFDAAPNMTIEAGVLAAVLQVDDGRTGQMLDRFYERHAGDHLLVDKWFELAAAKPAQSAAARIETLAKHSAFTFKTPNRVYALIGGFTGGNLAGFHARDGSGYRLLADVIITLNNTNPQVASRMATSFRSWKQYEAERRTHAAREMQRILGTQGLSNDVYEIISRTLA